MWTKEPEELGLFARQDPGLIIRIPIKEEWKDMLKIDSHGLLCFEYFKDSTFDSILKKSIVEHILVQVLPDLKVISSAGHLELDLARCLHTNKVKGQLEVKMQTDTKTMHKTMYVSFFGCIKVEPCSRPENNSDYLLHYGATHIVIRLSKLTLCPHYRCQNWFGKEKLDYVIQHQPQNVSLCRLCRLCWGLNGSENQKKFGCQHSRVGQY